MLHGLVSPPGEDTVRCVCDLRNLVMGRPLDLMLMLMLLPLLQKYLHVLLLLLLRFRQDLGSDLWISLLLRS